MELKVNNKTFPPQLEIVEEDGFTKVVPIENFDNFCDDIIKKISTTPFEEVRLLKIIKAFEADSITIKENE